MVIICGWHPLLGLLIAWLALFVGLLGERKGRRFGVWYTAFLLFPIALIHGILLTVPEKRKKSSQVTLVGYDLSFSAEEMCLDCTFENRSDQTVTALRMEIEDREAAEEVAWNVFVDGLQGVGSSTFVVPVKVELPGTEIGTLKFAVCEVWLEGAAKTCE